MLGVAITRRIIAPSLVAVSVAVCASMHDLADASASPCHPNGARPVLNRRYIAVFTIDTPDGPREYACYKPNGTRLDMGAGNGEVVFQPPAMRTYGRVIGWALSGANEDTGPAGGGRITLVYRARYYRPGEKPHSRGWAMTAASRAGYKANARVGSLVVRPSRAIAWIACPPPKRSGRATCEKPGHRDTVYSARSYFSGRHRVAVGNNIDPRSLRRDGDRISWKQGNSRRSAPFPP
jgi:hypothetical protein